ncbi:hypothetical protein HQ529_05145 [Candidatus Woesearchaeota archaeon]|nr:hypothetical protein [Candidatus Woesearchaeota archaeon]
MKDDESRKEYFNRWLQLKPVIQENNELIKNIETIVKSHIPEEVPNYYDLIIGRGDSHLVFWVGNIVNPLNRGELDIALRIYYGSSINLGSPSIAPEMGAFEDAFVQGKNPPYFIGCVSWKNPHLGLNFYSFLTEDLSNRKNRKIDDIDLECCTRGYSKEIFFIDPTFYHKDETEVHGQKYVKNALTIQNISQDQ